MGESRRSESEEDEATLRRNARRQTAKPLLLIAALVVGVGAFTIAGLLLFGATVTASTGGNVGGGGWSALIVKVVSVLTLGATVSLALAWQATRAPPR